jgi:hypothetical protein
MAEKSTLLFIKTDKILPAEFIDPARGNLLGFMNVRRDAPARAHVFSHELDSSYALRLN